ncbi:MAG: isoprenylcysteine carboxylmethyltransferase family protein [Desulfobacterales bacterium]|jgi:protein-S-isoprenylcysteine O-methyltransferase Ste14
MGLIIALIVLPGTALVFVPAIILTLSESLGASFELASPHQILFWLALLPAGVGLGLAFWTVKLFKEVGKGTPAPWDPPGKLVIRGPYRHVRNPMIAGALLILLAEAILFQSWPIAVWMVVFFISSTIYFRFIEEKGLEKRFGDNYREYKAHVPRWIPRLKPWNGEDDQA